LLLSGAVGAGKSVAGCMKGYRLNMKYPGNRGLIVRKAAISLRNSTIRTLLGQIIPHTEITSYNQMTGILRHRTGKKDVFSEIVFCGLDKRADQQYPTKIGSTEYGWIFLDEGIEATKEDWDMLTSRLRHKIPDFEEDYPRQIFTATNPDSPNHWMYEFFFKEKKEDREAFLCTPYDNPMLPEDYIKSLEESFSGLARERLLLGKWVQAEGIIYPSFDLNKHVVEKAQFLELKDYKRVIFGADSNYPLPRAAVLIGIKGDGTVDLIDEFYQTAHVEDLIKWLKEWKEKRGWTIFGYHDPSDPASIDKINRESGISCEKADNTVIAGISEVNRYFEKNLIKISKDCVNLIKELQSYRWKDKGKEQPLKEEDHLMDSLRYALMSIKPSIQGQVIGAKIFQ